MQGMRNTLEALPTRAEFIRDRLSDHLADSGCDVYEEEGQLSETEFDWPTLAFTGWGIDGTVCVDSMGIIRAVIGMPPAPLIFPGFEWRADETATCLLGVVHGPLTYAETRMERARAIACRFSGQRGASR